MKAFNKEEVLEKGDEVIIATPNYRRLSWGKVVGFTPEKVRIEYTWNGRTQRILVYPNTVVKMGEK